MVHLSIAGCEVSSGQLLDPNADLFWTCGDNAESRPRRIIEEEIESAIDSRNESLPTLRELGPPDLVHLVKQSTKSGNKQV